MASSSTCAPIEQLRPMVASILEAPAVATRLGDDESGSHGSRRTRSGGLCSYARRAGHEQPHSAVGLCQRLSSCPSCCRSILRPAVAGFFLRGRGCGSARGCWFSICCAMRPPMPAIWTICSTDEPTTTEEEEANHERPDGRLALLLAAPFSETTPPSSLFASACRSATLSLAEPAWCCLGGKAILHALRSAALLLLAKCCISARRRRARSAQAVWSALQW